MAWANDNVWAIVARQDWIEAWAYATSAHNVNFNPDTGQRDDVINDGMILAVVQATKPVT